MGKALQRFKTITEKHAYILCGEFVYALQGFDEAAVLADTAGALQGYGVAKREIKEAAHAAQVEEIEARDDLSDEEKRLSIADLNGDDVGPSNVRILADHLNADPAAAEAYRTRLRNVFAAGVMGVGLLQEASPLKLVDLPVHEVAALTTYDEGDTPFDSVTPKWAFEAAGVFDSSDLVVLSGLILAFNRTRAKELAPKALVPFGETSSSGE